jgi:hypothetical protein
LSGSSTPLPNTARRVALPGLVVVVVVVVVFTTAR